MSNMELMTRKEAIEILKAIIPKDRRGNGKILTDLAVTKAIFTAIEALEKEQETKWISASNPPKQDGKYLVSTHCFGCDDIEVLSYANNLYEVDDFDFWNAEERAGWYEYDAEYGYCEFNGVVAWQPLPEPYSGSEE